MTHAIIAAAAVAWLIGGVEIAGAQGRRPAGSLLAPADPPQLELGLGTGIWNLNGLGGGDLAIRASRHWNELLGYELGLHTGRAQRDLPRYALVEATVRLTFPHPAGRGGGFVRLGLGGGTGLTYRLSPAVGAGYEAWSTGRVVAVRAELLVLRDGVSLRDRGLLSVGLSVRVR